MPVGRCGLLQRAQRCVLACEFLQSHGVVSHLEVAPSDQEIVAVPYGMTKSHSGSVQESLSART